MSRTPRTISATGIYHVMMRGINHQIIFRDDDDYRHFLLSMQRAQMRISYTNQSVSSNCTYYAYCLMPNHVHLLVKEDKLSIGKIVKSLADSFVYYYNHKYQRDGHLFKERYRSEPVNDMAYFTMLLRYIHRNPVEAHLTEKVIDYPYSSWREYLPSANSSLSVCNTGAVLRRIPFKELEEMVNAPLPDDLHCIDI